MLSEREQTTHALDHALTQIGVLLRVDPSNVTLKEIADAMDAAYVELTRRGA
jgi:hypothetical protein